MSEEPRPAGLVWHRDLCDLSGALVDFVIPGAAQAVVLQVRHADESTDIPADLSSKPRG